MKAHGLGWMISLLLNFRWDGKNVWNGVTLLKRGWGTKNCAEDQRGRPCECSGALRENGLGLLMTHSREKRKKLTAAPSTSSGLIRSMFEKVVRFCHVKINLPKVNVLGKRQTVNRSSRGWIVHEQAARTIRFYQICTSDNKAENRHRFAGRV